MSIGSGYDGSEPLVAEAMSFVSFSQTRPRDHGTPLGRSHSGQALQGLRQALESQGCRPTSRGTALCPAHDDNRPSLSFRADGGTVLLFCHAACPTEAVLAALGLSFRDLYDEPRARGRQDRVVAEYRYVDENGELLFIKERREPKSFRCKRLVDGRWDYKLGDVRRVLYNLPAVIAAVAAGRPIWVVEGEKDADRLSRLGEVATCNHDGAAKGSQSKWKSEYGDVLVGAHVIVVPDKDVCGYAHAQSIVADLRDKAASVQIVQAARGNDLSDHLGAGLALADLEPCLPALAPPITALGRVEVREVAAEQHRGQLRMAERLVRREYDRLRYVHGEGWRVWDGRRWDRDRDGVAKRAVMATTRAAYADLPDLGLKDQRELLADIHGAESASGLEGVLRLAGAIKPLAVSVDQLDPDPMLLNTHSGTLDLHTGELRPHSPSDLITKICGTGYDPQAHSQSWITFLSDVLPQEPTRSFVARLFGHTLEGRVTEQVLPILIGSGCNGKSTLLGVVGAALGDYAITADPELLIDRPGSHPTGQADLLGVRLAVCHESNAGSRLGAATVKRLTGGDTIRARRMRQDFIEFEPSHSILLVTNHKPLINGDDPAMWRRVRVVPFDVTITNPDPGLKDRLMLELPAVLNWMVAGHREWMRHKGLGEPTHVLDATAAFQADSDALGRFLRERTLQLPAATVGARELYAAWTKWAHTNGEDAGSEVTFSASMLRRGVDKKRGAGGQRWFGLGLVTDPLLP